MTILVTGATGFIGKKTVIQLAKRKLDIVAADFDLGENKNKLINEYKKFGFDLKKLKFEKLDITNQDNIDELFNKYSFEAVIHLAYGIGMICENNPILASKINIVGTTSIFEKIVEKKIKRMVFASSETVYGANQSYYGNRPINENDFCGIDQHYFTYGVMKLLNEFMAEKYIKKFDCSIAYTRPSVVFGYGRQNTALNWAEDFAAKPAVGEKAHLPFSKKNIDNWIYVEDCAEQLVRLSLKKTLKFSSYNTGSETITGDQLVNTVRKFIPEAKFFFDEKIKNTPLINDQDDFRIREEIDFTPRSFEKGVLQLINDVRLENNFKPIKN
ncbi:NAD(P)-dependent oxidoreductase [Alphaproteobacteria bacterium]|nr:NAD(P)-dependent oxidoreductase [Alphaproteobacteria bacterium]